MYFDLVGQGVGVLEFVLHHGRGVIGGVNHQFLVQDALPERPASGQLQSADDKHY